MNQSTIQRAGSLGSGRSGRRLLLLLSSELASALGIEFFNITVLWHIIKMLGAHGAYYLAATLLCAVMSGVLGAGLFDRARPFRCTAGLNLLRLAAAALAVACIVVGWPLPWLLVSSLCLSASRPHLDAALIGGLTTLRLEAAALQKANAMVDNMARLARIAGPGLAALMAWLGNEVLALSLTLACFGGASVLQWRLDRSLDADAKPTAVERLPYWDTLMAGFRIAGRSPALVYCFLSQMVNAGAWYLGFVFSAALVLSSAPAGASAGVGAFATASLCYGLGNIGGNLVTSRLAIQRPMHFIVAGRALSAVGYFLLASVGARLAGMCLCAALIALGTPPADLAFLKVLQTGYDWREVTKLYRVKVVAEYAGMLLMMLAAPGLLRLTSPSGVIAVCGGAMGIVALAGCVLLKKQSVIAPTTVNHHVE